MKRTYSFLFAVSIIACGEQTVQKKETLEVQKPLTLETVKVEEDHVQHQHGDCACMMVPTEECQNACCDPNYSQLLVESCQCVAE